MLLQYLFSHPQFFIVWILAIIYAITIHEFSHALASWRLGDRTAKDLGRLTLNPLSHLDPLGSIMLLLAGFGWGKPVPFNPYALKYPRWGSSLVAMAGPISNMLSVALFGLILHVLSIQGVVDEDSLLTLFLVAMITVNTVLALFNLIPLPPMDGSKVLFALLPDRYAGLKMTLERNGPFILLGLILLDNFSPTPILGTLFQAALTGVFNLLG